jgi:asparagine synthetase B (glutamine-hydrolysing)
MSGIVGMLNLDGSPIDGSLLGRMTAYLAFRGPHRQRVQVAKNVGLGQALLRITEESAHEDRPFTLDGRRWIVASGRLKEMDPQRDPKSSWLSASSHRYR